MGSAVIGALRVTLGLDSAEFISGMQAAQSRMSTMSKGFAADSATVRNSAKALGMSVGQMTREIGAIKAVVDPASVALGQYQKQALLLRQSMALGVITQQQYKASVQAAHAAYQSAGQGIVGTSGAMRAGMQQVGFQVSDLAVQIASGTSAVKAFAMQGPQMVQAISLMSGSTGKFAAFMSGPWGAVLTAGTAILGALGVAYMNSAKSAETATDASSALSEVQSLLGEAFDLTTGKINSMTGALGKNTEAAILNLQVNSMLLKQEAIKQRESFAATKQQGGKYKGAFGTTIDRPTGSGPLARRAGGMSVIQSILQGVESGKIDSTAAFDRIKGLNFSNSAITRDEAFKALTDIVDAQRKEMIAGDIEKSLSSGQLSGGFRDLIKTPKGRKPPKGKVLKDRTAEIDARFASDIERLNDEELRAKLDLATNAEDRLDLSMDLLKSERDARVREIESNKDFSQAQKAAQIAYIDRLYGKNAETSPDGEIITQAKPGLLAQAEQRKLEEEQTRLANDMLGRQAETLTAMADIEPNTKHRARLEQEALRLQEQIQANLIEQQIANGQIADADKARALLAQQQEIGRKKLALQQMTPGQRYLYGLNEGAQPINEAIEDIKIDGLDRLNDGLVDAMMGVKSLGAVFKGVARQIIADLIQIAIRRTIVASLANMLGLGGGGSLGGLFGGGGGGGSASVGSAFAGVRADRGGAFRVLGRPGIDQNLLSLNGSPAAFVSQGELVNIGRGNQGGGGSSVVHIIPTPYFDAVVDGRAARVAAPMAAASGHFARTAAGGDMARKARRRIPG